MMMMMVMRMMMMVRMIDDDYDDEKEEEDDEDDGYLFIDDISQLSIGDIDAALSYYEKALTILAFTLGNHHH